MILDIFFFNSSVKKLLQSFEYFDSVRRCRSRDTSLSIWVSSLRAKNCLLDCHMLF
ncbi:uncharacterized protein DS421_6g197680 [Arachis hypogaea]|nr:uncharacterized protein DS421_6g197680 [Arachis hypogaea]